MSKYSFALMLPTFHDSSKGVEIRALHGLNYHPSKGLNHGKPLHHVALISTPFEIAGKVDCGTLPIGVGNVAALCVFCNHYL